MSDDDIAALALALAGSGTVLTPSDDRADVASTGGPASLSTLLCPLFLRADGWVVPKLAVPGRPAGGIDVLAQVPGYRTVLSHSEVLDVLVEAGYAHFEAGREWAPADAASFATRQRTGRQAVPELVIASLLSKKLAVGVRNLGLDVRTAPFANFGKNVDEARMNAQRFRRVAGLLGIEARFCLTDATSPYQPYVGRGEALLALRQFFRGSLDAWSAAHVDDCRKMVEATVGHRGGTQSAPCDAQAAFSSNLSAQGSSFEAFEEIAEHVERSHDRCIHAGVEGMLRWHVARLRDVIVRRQTLACGGVRHADPLGVVLLARNGSIVEKDRAVMSVRTAHSDWVVLRDELATCFSIDSTPRRTSQDELN